MAVKYALLYIVLLSIVINGRYASVPIVPQEARSLISNALATLVPIKKGTDSRVGFGFALGNHADFQVMFELGPQSLTAPVGSSFAASTKRHIPKSEVPSTSGVMSEKVSKTTARQYLQQWAHNMKNLK